MSLQRDVLFDVSGKVAVVTGGGTGIGLMMATALENNGALVYILGRRLEVLTKAAQENAKFGKIVPLQCDVTSREDILSAVKKIEEDVGFVDILINNSGISKNSIKDASAESDIRVFRDKLWNAGTPEEFTLSFDVNVKAVYYTTVAFLELLDAGNKRHASPHEPKSQVIITSSIAGFRRDGTLNSLSYNTSKAAATHLGKAFSSLLAPHKIRSNVIAPGIYPSEMTASIVKDDPRSPVEASVIPAERFGTAEDMGGLVLFLSSRAGGYVNGGVHVTDGGRLGLFSNTF